MKEPDTCPECGKPATPHCTGNCPWLTCTDVGCSTTWHPGRPEIVLRPQP